MKNKINTKCNIGGSILKARAGNPLKSGQIVKRENVPKVINNIPKSKTKTGKTKRFKPIIRGETIRPGPKINKLYNFISAKGTGNRRADTYSYRINNLNRVKSRGGNRPSNKQTDIVIPEDGSGNNSARLSSKIKRTEIATAEIKKQFAGRNHHKNSVESSKIPRTSHLLHAKTSDRANFN
ncbi:unnamed protein product [Moneuplotes crassus]|uniref:Uncharacterized protein n=1 Tax=Euplotes crassus TaxID=5936 RepID=A0AAD1UNE8_EUPCR|nr:unnamed protein product [Moneuplotes crassus]